VKKEAPRAKTGTIEENIGRTWLSRLGVIFISVALLLFLKTTYDRIGPAARVGLGFLAGTVLLAIGLWTERKHYRATAAGLIAAGCVAYYLSAFASYAVYHLLARLPALGLMGLITSVTLLLAMRHKQPFIAITGLAGGFLAPLLLGAAVGKAAGDQGYMPTIIGYLAVLDLGLLWLASFRRWSVMIVLSFIATHCYLLAGRGDLLNLSGAAALFSVVLFYLIFAAQGVYQSIFRRQLSQWHETLLAIVNGLALLGWTIFIFHRHWNAWIGIGVIGVACVHFLLGLGLLARNRLDKTPLFINFGLAIAYATLALPLQLRGNALILTWLLEAVFLVWLGQRLCKLSIRATGAAIYCLGLLPALFEACRLLIKTGVAGKALWLPPELWGLLAAAAGAYFLAAAYRKTQVPDKAMGMAYRVLASLLAAVLLSCQWWLGPGMIWTGPAASWVQLGFFLIWAVEAIYLWTRDQKRAADLGPVSALGLTVFILLVVKELINACFHYANPFRRIWCDGYLWQGIGVAALTVMLGLLWPEKDADKKRKVKAGFILAATIELWLLLTCEVLTWPSSLLPASVKGFALSAVWTVFAAAMIAIGLRKRWRGGRLLGLGLLGLPLVKVFFFDLRLRGMSRVFSFLGLGAVLIGLSYLYQRWGAVFFDSDAVDKPPPVAD
jgi:uncharacterized membrane protein